MSCPGHMGPDSFWEVWWDNILETPSGDAYTDFCRGWHQIYFVAHVRRLTEGLPVDPPIPDWIYKIDLRRFGFLRDTSAELLRDIFKTLAALETKVRRLDSLIKQDNGRPDR